MANLSHVVSRAVRAVALADAQAQSDRDLLNRFSDGDQVAFTVLVGRHAPMVLGVCRRLLGNVPDAEDVAQAVFVLLARKAKETKWRASVAGWLYAAARKVSRNARISRERRDRRESARAVKETPSPLDEMTARELLSALDEELDRLPERYREPLVLCYLEGLTRDEASRRLQVPSATLKSQLERGRKRLADALAARGCCLSVMLLAATTGISSATSRFVNSTLTAASGKLSPTVSALIQGVAVNGFLKSNLLAFLCVGTVLIGLGLAGGQLNSAPQEKSEPTKKVEKKIEESKTELKENDPVIRIGSTRFRADAPIGSAGYSHDGRRIVAHAGMTLYVWDAKDGTLLRKIDTKLARLTDPEDDPYVKVKFAFAVHPKLDRVAWVGRRGGKTVLQVWDFATGEKFAECETAQPQLLALVWTPDGKSLIERSWLKPGNPNSVALVVRDGSLKAVHLHEQSENKLYAGEYLAAHPDGKRVVLYRSNGKPEVVNLESGETERTFAFDPTGPVELAISADGKMILLTGLNEMMLYDFESGAKLHDLPVTRRSWEKPGSRFSRDGKTVYVWDFRPMAYVVETGKLFWKANSPTHFGSGLAMHDTSPDGESVLCSVGNSIAFLDAKTGREREATESPGGVATLFWSPDGKTLFSRNAGHRRGDRSFTAWDAASGKRHYHVNPGDEFNDEWKLAPDLFFLHGGKEFLACVEKSASSEQSAFKQLLIFDTATGKVLRKLGDELKENYRWMYPVNVSEDGSRVLMQAYAVAMGKETEYATLLWDAEKQTAVKEWKCLGNRYDSPRRFAPYNLFLGGTNPTDLLRNGTKPEPSHLRFYSATDGSIVHRLESEFTSIDAERIQGGYLLTTGYNSGWKTTNNTSRFLPTTPYHHEIWEIATGEKVKLFETPKASTEILGPGGRYVIRVGGNGFEIYEPFVLKKSVLAVETPLTASQFEFSIDGTKLAASLADTTIAIWDTTPWQKKIDEELRKEIPLDLTPLFDDLAKEPEKAFRASRLLSLAETRTIRMLAEKIQPKQAPEAAVVQKLIRELDSEGFAVRQRAEKQLRLIAPQIENQLRRVLKDAPSEEVKRRVEELLKAIEKRKLTPEECRELRAVAVLKAIGGNDAKALLAKWATGDPTATLTKATK